MLYVISYDVPDDRRRLKVARTLEQYGRRVQYSVFEAHLDGRALERLKARLTAVLEAEMDGLRIYRLCGECERAAETIGRAGVTPAPGVVIV